jgi:O-antigen ligase
MGLVAYIQEKDLDVKKSINILLVLYAFCLPISKAGTSLFEILILILWIIEGNWKEKCKLLLGNLLSLTIIFLIFFSLCSIMWSNDLLNSLDYILKYRHLLIILVIFTSFEKKYMEHILSAFLYAMLISEMLSYGIHFELIQYKNISPSDPSPFMSHMSYSTFLAFASIIILTKFFDTNILKYKLFYSLFFLSLTANLFINGGRTGQVIFIFVILLSFIMQFKNKIIAFFIALIFLIITFYSAYNISGVFHNRVNQLNHDIAKMVNSNDYGGSFGSRVSLWIVGFDKFLDNKFYGSGIGSEMEEIGKYAANRNFNSSHMKNFADHHNTFITLLVQLGFLGLIINLMLFSSLIKLIFISGKYQIISCAFVITFVLFSFTHQTLHTMFPMVFFALFAGILNKYDYITRFKDE